MLKAIDHIGFAVHDIDEAIAFYGAMFGVTDWERIAVPERFMDVAAAHVGDVLLELIAPNVGCGIIRQVLARASARACIISPIVWTTLQPRWHS